MGGAKRVSRKFPQNQTIKGCKEFQGRFRVLFRGFHERFNGITGISGAFKYIVLRVSGTFQGSLSAI